MKSTLSSNLRRRTGASNSTRKLLVLVVSSVLLGAVQCGIAQRLAPTGLHELHVDTGARHLKGETTTAPPSTKSSTTTTTTTTTSQLPSKDESSPSKDDDDKDDDTAASNSGNVGVAVGGGLGGVFLTLACLVFYCKRRPARGAGRPQRQSTFQQSNPIASKRSADSASSDGAGAGASASASPQHASPPLRGSLRTAEPSTSFTQRAHYQYQLNQALPLVRAATLEKWSEVHIWDPWSGEMKQFIAELAVGAQMSFDPSAAFLAFQTFPKPIRTFFRVLWLPFKYILMGKWSPFKYILIEPIRCTYTFIFPRDETVLGIDISEAQASVMSGMKAAVYAVCMLEILGFFLMSQVLSWGIIVLIIAYVLMWAYARRVWANSGRIEDGGRLRGPEVAMICLLVIVLSVRSILTQAKIGGADFSADQAALCRNLADVPFMCLARHGNSTICAALASAITNASIGTVDTPVVFSPCGGEEKAFLWTSFVLWTGLSIWSKVLLLRAVRWEAAFEQWRHSLNLKVAVFVYNEAHLCMGRTVQREVSFFTTFDGLETLLDALSTSQANKLAVMGEMSRSINRPDVDYNPPPANTTTHKYTRPVQVPVAAAEPLSSLDHTMHNLSQKTQTRGGSGLRQRTLSQSHADTQQTNI